VAFGLKWKERPPELGCGDRFIHGSDEIGEKRR